MANGKGKKKTVEEENQVEDWNTKPVDVGAVGVQNENTEKPVEKADEKTVEKAGRNDYILRLMESRRKAMDGEK